MSINEILPWLELPEPFAPITMHHLLTHTSGLMIGVEHAPWSRIDALLARQFPPTMEPGERFWYSNLAYKLVGFALEDVTGMPIQDLLTERLTACSLSPIRSPPSPRTSAPTRRWVTPRFWTIVHPISTTRSRRPRGKRRTQPTDRSCRPRPTSAHTPGSS